jgi:hypothetical protein
MAKRDREGPSPRLLTLVVLFFVHTQHMVQFGSSDIMTMCEDYLLISHYVCKACIMYAT